MCLTLAVTVRCNQLIGGPVQAAGWWCCMVAVWAAAKLGCVCGDWCGVIDVALAITSPFLLGVVIFDFGY